MQMRIKNPLGSSCLLFSPCRTHQQGLQLFFFSRQLHSIPNRHLFCAVPSLVGTPRKVQVSHCSIVTRSPTSTLTIRSSLCVWCFFLMFSFVVVCCVC